MENDATTHSRDVNLIIDPPAAGAWNMAVDEALLEQAVEGDCVAGDCVTLRFYEWAEPTLSLGYFQSHTERQSHMASASCPLVRRQSGGGAILHDRELTYSLIVPPGHELARDAQKLYSTVHQTIIAALTAFLNLSSKEWTAQIWEDQGNEKNPEPFLCFQRRAAGDVVLSHEDGSHYKIVGSAQRRRRGVILQHGSILLERSSAAPELPGLNDIVRSNLSSQTLIGKLCDTLPAQLQLSGLPPVRGIESTTVCKASAEQLLDMKHTSTDWLHRR